MLGTEELLEARMYKSDFSRSLFNDKSLSLGIDRKYLTCCGGRIGLGEVDALRRGKVDAQDFARSGKLHARTASLFPHRESKSSDCCTPLVRIGRMAEARLGVTRSRCSLIRMDFKQNSH